MELGDFGRRLALIMVIVAVAVAFAASKVNEAWSPPPGNAATPPGEDATAAGRPAPGGTNVVIVRRPSR